MLQSKDIKDIFPIRKSNTNKGDYGYIAIMGGCINYLGAVKLAKDVYKRQINILSKTFELLCFNIFNTCILFTTF